MEHVQIRRRMLNRGKERRLFCLRLHGRDKIRRRSDRNRKFGLLVRRARLLKRHAGALFCCRGLRGLLPLAMIGLAAVVLSKRRLSKRQHEELRTRHAASPQKSRDHKSRNNRTGECAGQRVHYRRRADRKLYRTPFEGCGMLVQFRDRYSDGALLHSSAGCHGFGPAPRRDRDFRLRSDLATYLSFLKPNYKRLGPGMFGRRVPVLLCPHRGRRADSTACEPRVHFAGCPRRKRPSS